MKKIHNGVPVWWLLALFIAFCAGSLVGIWMVGASTACRLMVGS